MNKEQNIFVRCNWHLWRHMDTRQFVLLFLLATFRIWPPECKRHCIFSSSYLICFLFLIPDKLTFLLLSPLCVWPKAYFSNSTIHFLPLCSLYALSPLHHWPSEPHVRPERGLCDLQLCLLSTQTSVRTAGRVREGQTVERQKCTQAG